MESAATSSGAAPRPMPAWRRLLTLPFRLLHALYHWVVGWSGRPGGTIALGVISFAEASFFPIPPDPLLWALCIGKRKRSFWYATVTTVTSVLGGIFGWMLGMYLFADVVTWAIDSMGAQATWHGTAESLADPAYADKTALTVRGWTFYPDGYLHQAGRLFDEWGAFALFVAALTPIPYKVATIAGGLFGMNLWALIIGSVFGRGLRFYAFGALFFFFGDWAKQFIERYFAWLTILLVVLLLLGFYAIRFVV